MPLLQGYLNFIPTCIHTLIGGPHERRIVISLRHHYDPIHHSIVVAHIRDFSFIFFLVYGEIVSTIPDKE